MGKHFDQKKMVAVVFLPILAIIVVVTNNSLVNKEKTQNERGIASLQSPSKGVSVDWEQALAAELARGREKRIPASARSRPDAVQELVFGPLEGKYRISRVDGRVAEVEFIDSSIGSDRPKYVGSPDVFLQEYSGAWAVDFTDVRIVSQEEIGASVVHQLELLDDANNITGSAVFITEQSGSTDTPGRLLRLKVTSL